MKNRILMMVAGALLAVGCGAGGSDYCNRAAACPNDTPPTQSDRDQCKATFQANQNAACYGEANSYLNCAADNIVCGGNGMTDANLSATKATNNCTNQKANLTSCCIKNPNSTVCS